MATMMTIGELKKAIEKLDDRLPMVVMLDRGDTPFELLEIESVDAHQGTPLRGKNGVPSFKFESSGIAMWVFITVTRESHD